MIKIKGTWDAVSDLSDSRNLEKAVQNLDPQGMLRFLQDFPEQIIAAQEFAAKPKLKLKNPVTNILFSGLGGSAICGDLIRESFSDLIGKPILVNRDYQIPAWVDRNTLVILISYSGNTEETISAYQQALTHKAAAAVVCSGGRLAELSGTNGTPLLKIPAGYPPRTALGYLFFSILNLLAEADLLKMSSGQMKDLLSTIRITMQLNGLKAVFDGNPARQLAAALKGTLPVIYSGNPLSAVATRWKTQFEENSKNLAFTGQMPEMNHNEVVGWVHPKEMLEKMSVVFLRDRDEHPQIAQRFRITSDILKPRRFICEVESTASRRLERLFSLIVFGDWVSYYLALENRVSPTPVERITGLKNRLAKK